ncbi:Uncharacterised protein [Trueperella bialowiezensis]|uniref:Uncharacterized protein n=1 Tax=Trueperella bialowiezensis TaxID=312285 RepID=A0A3S4VTK3_9ACTO|nr:Uncharacterised protein [Trueperella bialowiezensis]
MSLEPEHGQGRSHIQQAWSQHTVGFDKQSSPVHVLFTQVSAS